MAKKRKAKAETARAKDSTVMSNGITVEGKVITGEDTKLSAREQGQLARGEIDEKGNPTGKEVRPRDAVRTIQSDRPLYQGKLTVSAVAGATGQPVSVVYVQEMPTTEEGVFWALQQYHPSAIRDTMKIDPSNTDDPTLRTSLEK